MPDADKATQDIEAALAKTQKNLKQEVQAHKAAHAKAKKLADGLKKQSSA